MRQTVAYIRANLKDDLSVPLLCGKTHLSESAFSRLFKRETGVSVVKYINTERVRRACDLLGGTEKQIQEIAWDVGIDNPNYFSIMFKKETGFSPNEYRVAQMQKHDKTPEK